MSERPVWMGPSVTIDEALRSDAKRRERDLQLAAWCGLPDDEVGPFLRRLQVFDARTIEWEAREARRRAAEVAGDPLRVRLMERLS